MCVTAYGWGNGQYSPNYRFGRRNEREIKVDPDSTTNHARAEAASRLGCQKPPTPGTPGSSISSRSPTSTQVVPGAASPYSPYNQNPNSPWPGNVQQNQEMLYNQQRNTWKATVAEKLLHEKQEEQMFSPASAASPRSVSSLSPHQMSQSSSVNLDGSPQTPRPPSNRSQTSTPVSHSDWLPPGETEGPWDFNSSPTTNVQPSLPSPFRIPKGRPPSRSSNLHSNPGTPLPPASESQSSPAPTFLKPFPPNESKSIDYQTQNPNGSLEPQNNSPAVNSSHSNETIPADLSCKTENPLQKDCSNDLHRDQQKNSQSELRHELSQNIKQEHSSSNVWHSMEDVKQLSDYQSTMYGTTSAGPFVPVNPAYNYPNTHTPNYPTFTDTKPFHPLWTEANGHADQHQGTPQFPHYPQQPPNVDVSPQLYSKTENSKVPCYHSGSTPYGYQVSIETGIC